MSGSLPVGPVVSPHPARRPERQTIEGRYTRLAPLEVSHAAELFKQLCNPSKPPVWTYIPNGIFDPLTIEENFAKHIEALSRSEDPFIFTIITKTDLPDAAAGSPVGYLGLMSIVPAHRIVEIGHVVFSPALQRTTVATEALYLAMRYSVEDLGNRRLEWKCDALNAKSRRAAERLGFTYEGTFRKHRIVNGRNRDSAYLSVTDDEWEVRKKALELWLDGENFEGGRQKRGLEEIRRTLVG